MGFWPPEPNCYALISKTKKRSAYLQTGGGNISEERSHVCQRGALFSHLHGQKWLKGEREGCCNAMRQGRGMRQSTTICNNPYSHTPDQGWRGGGRIERERLLQCNEARTWYEKFNYCLQQPIFPHPRWRGGEYVLDTPLLGPLVLVGVQANGDKKSWVS